METTSNEPKPNTADDLERDLQEDVRSVMRNIPSSVAVITVTGYDAELKKMAPMGVAVSSLSTVSLNPPTISFNLKEPSKTLDAIRASGGSFRVHFPMANRAGANMVDLFSHGNHAQAYSMRKKELRFSSPDFRFSWGSRETSASQAPKILGDFVRAALECSVTQELSVADHVLLVAKIATVEDYRSGQQSVTYVNGSYMRPDGTKITYHKIDDVTTKSEDTWSIWDSPLFPGEAERRNYMMHIKTVIKKDRTL